jgi:hypothetical protein
MLYPVKPHVLFGAGAALPMAVTGMDVGILRREFVTSFTMGLFRIKAPSAIDVHLWRHRLQMRRIAAAPCSAQMVQLRTSRNRPAQQLVAKAVDVEILSIDSHNTVCADKRTAPEPAAGIGFWVNLILQAFRQRRQFIGHYSTPVWQKCCTGVNFLEPKT